MDLIIRPLEAADIPIIAAAFQAMGWSKPASQYEKYLAEQVAGQRLVLVAASRGTFAGYLTICWQSPYPPFREARIPEIQDFNVLLHFRRQGIGTKLMDRAEAIVAERSAIVGIGFGLYADYGAAQRLYVRRGYVPDGKGVAYCGTTVEPGKAVPVDDDLVLYLTKALVRQDEATD